MRPDLHLLHMGEHSASPATNSPITTPRHSLDGLHFPSSPRFYAFKERFRKTSNTGSATSDTSHEVEPTKDEAKAEAVKQAKTLLLSTVRDDWEFPVQSHEVQYLEDTREPLDYCLRTEGGSDIESDASIKSGKLAALTKVISNPYKFESPDAVASSVGEGTRKRRRMLRSEMEWNEGLRNWLAQRDRWTGAVPSHPRKRENHTRLCQLHGLHDRNSLQSTLISAHCPSFSEALTRDSITTPSSDCPETIDESEEGPYLPIFPPLIPNSNPIRANIKPAAYPIIYSKVVIQNLTPTVPIPLSHMTKALVEGWKAEGNWPPQPAPPEIGKVLKFRKRNGEKGKVRRGLDKAKRAFKSKHNDCNDKVSMDFENEEMDEDMADDIVRNKVCLNGG